MEKKYIAPLTEIINVYSDTNFLGNMDSDGDSDVMQAKEISFDEQEENGQVGGSLWED